jgi:hypothetical protein
VAPGLASAKTITLAASDFNGPPQPPTGLSVQSMPSFIQLEWTDSSSTETGFVVERKKDAGEFTQLAALGAGIEAWQDASADGGTYLYRVKARNDFGSSLWAEAPAIQVAGLTITVTYAVGTEAPIDLAGSPEIVKGAALVLVVSQGYAAYAWYLDGSAIPFASGQSASLDTLGLALGQHRAAVIVTDGGGAGSSKELLFSVVAPPIVDHGHFDPAPVSDEAIAEAAALSVYFEHASVGDNIAGGIAALELGESRYDDTKLTRNNRGNPDYADPDNDAALKIAGFESSMGTVAADVAFFKFCYIDIPSSGSALFDSVRAAMEGLEAAHPATTFVWWTMPIETLVWDPPPLERQAYNNAVRSYCSSSGRWLFDLADLESHDDSGSPVVHASSGSEALCGDYALDNGHLNAAGAAKMAKAYWMLLAEIARAR